VCARARVCGCSRAPPPPTAPVIPTPPHLVYSTRTSATFCNIPTFPRSALTEPEGTWPARQQDELLSRPKTYQCCPRDGKRTADDVSSVPDLQRQTAARHIGITQTHRRGSIQREEQHGRETGGLREGGEMHTHMTHMWACMGIVYERVPEPVEHTLNK
jgi:hypothetical protein